MDQGRLFTNQPLSLEGYTPRFSKEEMRMGFETYEVQPYDPYADEKPPSETNYRLRVMGVTIDGGRLYYDWQESVARAVRGWLDDKLNEKRHPELWQFITANTRNLDNSLRYWRAVDREAALQQARDDIERRQQQLVRAELMHQLQVRQVLEERRFSDEERKRAWAELTDLPFNE